jgi:hypothetical protein
MDMNEVTGANEPAGVMEPAEPAKERTPESAFLNTLQRTPESAFLNTLHRTPEESAFLNTLHQRKVIDGALKDGTLACLPGKDGYADTEPAVNLATGTRYHGTNQLYLKDFQKKNGFPTAEYVTAQAADKSGIPIRKGQRGVWIGFSAQNEAGQWEQKNVRLFNIAQAVNPVKMKEAALGMMAEKQREKTEYLRQMYGESYRPREPKEQRPGPEIACSSTDPEKYLGQYLAAVSMGGKFKVSGEQAAGFSRKMEASLFERMENGHTNPFKLSKICNAAGEHCKSVIREARAPKAEQAQKLEQKRGRSL